MTFSIAGRLVGGAHRPYVIAEVAQSHDGNLNFAHAFVDQVAEAGADAIKFQTHIAAAETTRDEPWRVKFSRIDDSRYDYWRRMEFSEDQWRELAHHATERGIAFVSTPFSLEAVDLLERVGMPVWKIASGEVTNTPLLERVARTGAPVLVSSGMSSWAELDGAVQTLRARGADFGVLQCTSVYPCPPERTGLNVIGQLTERYGCPVGLSDHSGAIYSSLAAVALGASVIEVHVTFHKAMFGPDVPASITFEDMRRLVDGADVISRALNSPIDKEAEAEGMAPMRRIFTKSVMAGRPLKAGAILTEADMILKKPGHGLPASALAQLTGAVLVVDVEADHVFDWADVTLPT